MIYLKNRFYNILYIYTLKYIFAKIKTSKKHKPIYIMSDKMQVSVTSEIGELEGVILHTPGSEVENMTPENAERALYSDILNLNVAQKEYAQFSGALGKITKTFQVMDLLKDVVSNDESKKILVDRICTNEGKHEIRDFLLDLQNEELARQLIEGVKMEKNTLTKYLNKDRYELRPLHNFFFTRDASSSVLDKVLINRMANKVREREAIIMETIFNYHPTFSTTTVNPVTSKFWNPKVTTEGGDILVAREDILLIGTGTRTSSHGIDFIIEYLKEKKAKRHIIVQELPETPESFIHLDMVFTFLDKDKCMVYEPLILKSNRYLTLHIYIEDGKVVSINKENNILDSLKKLGMDLQPIICGESADPYTQEREQWHSGANFFAMAPGKVIGYGRNSYTIDAMNKHGFEVIEAKDLIKDKIDINNYDKYVITIDGAELPRGGGGARCMTMPVRRKPVNW